MTKRGIMRKGLVIGAFFFIFFSFAVVLAQQTVITGKLLGSDGKPMIKANVSLTEGFNKPLNVVEVNKEGSYQLTTDKRGLFFLRFIGVNHTHKTTLMILEGDTSNIEVNVQLQTPEYLSENNFDNKLFKVRVPDQRPIEFQKQSDGTYLAEVKTTKDKIEYQISGLTLSGLSVNGTQSEDYIPDNITGYRSVVTAKNGTARITLDLKQLTKSDAKSKIEVRSKNPYILAGAKYSADLEESQDAYATFAATNPSEEEQQAYEQKQRQIDAEKATVIEKQLNEEKDPLLKQLLLLSYFNLPKEKVPEVVKIALNEIPLNSPFLSINTTLLTALLKVSAREKKETLLNQFLAKTEEPFLRAQIIYELFDEAKNSNNEEEAKKYYAMLAKDYETTPFAKIARMLSPELNKLKAGMAVPGFSIKSLEDPNKVISDNSLKGKYYLIDFWATWCGPCVGELGNLHKAHEKFKGKNFEILSISFDQNQEDIANFREKKWKMPWLHSFIEKSFQSELAKTFEVFGIPKPLLIDPEGKIVAIDDKLRGEELDKTLTEVLSKTQ